MKNKILTLTITAIVFLSGCIDLETAPYDRISDATFWKTEAQCKQGVMTVYNSLKIEVFLGMSQFFEGATDIGTATDGTWIGPLVMGTAHPGYIGYEARWQAYYETVQKANVAILNIGKAPINENTMKSLVAEAKFLRAYAYFLLVDRFGGVPLYDENDDLTINFGNMKKGRSTEDEVYALILSDLDYGTINLPVSYSTSDWGRITRGAAFALRGKVHLYRKSYKNAIRDFEEVIKPAYGYSLYNNYPDLFNLKGHNSSEMIWSVVNKGGTGNPYGMPLQLMYGNSSNDFAGAGNKWVTPSVELVDMFEYKDGKPFNWDVLFPGYTNSRDVKIASLYCKVKSNGVFAQLNPNIEKIDNMFKNRDPRLDFSVIRPYASYNGYYNSAPQTVKWYLAINEATNAPYNFSKVSGYLPCGINWQIYFFRKFVPEGDMGGLSVYSSSSHVPINWPMIRLADVFLMLAEAYNEDGNQTQAVTYINKVRDRVSVKMPFINSGPEWLRATSKQEVFERIFRERAFELSAENHRYDDLRRWRLCQKLLHQKEMVDIIGTVRTIRYFDEKYYLWPIPQKEMDNNPNLTQTPGW